MSLRKPVPLEKLSFRFEGEVKNHVQQRPSRVQPGNEAGTSGEPSRSITFLDHHISVERDCPNVELWVAFNCQLRDDGLSVL